MDPRSFIFGFGRRYCPGADLVESSVWILTASILATLDVKPPANGMPDVKYEDAIFRFVGSLLASRLRGLHIAFIRVPTKFNCDIQPRSALSLELIKGGMSQEF